MQKGTKGCKRGVTREMERRGPSVNMDKTTGMPWGPGDESGTTGLCACSFIVIFDEDFIIGSHIPPARADKNMQLTHSGVEIIDDHMGQIEALLPKVLKARTCMLVKAKTLDPADLTHIQKKLAEMKLNCVPREYDPANVPKGGIFVVHRKDGVWPPKGLGPV